MDTRDPDRLIRHVIAGEATAVASLLQGAAGSADPAVLVAAALVDPGWRALLSRAAACAGSARDRRLVAVAEAHLSGDADRVLLLARDHLADDPGSVLVAHIASLTFSPDKEPDS